MHPSGPAHKGRSSSIFHLPFRSSKKSDKPAPRSQSVSHESHRSLLNEGERRRNSGGYVHSSLSKGGSITDEYGTVYDVSQTSTKSSGVTNGSTFSHGGSSLRSGSTMTPYSSVTMADSHGDGWERDKQTGEVIDHTDMLHSLAPTQSQEDAPILQRMQTHEGTEPGQSVIDRFPEKVWASVIEDLEMADLASLALCCKAFKDMVGTESWRQLAEEENREQRLKFLPKLDQELPNHLLCFDCAVYHMRTQRGRETLRLANEKNPVYVCPNMSNPNKINPRTRITAGRILPFTFVQMVMRAQRFAPQYGVTIESLSRRYKDKEGSGSDWSHQTRFVVVKDHLLMRVTSQVFAPPGLPPSGERHLLYSRDDFVPYFSVCPHWRDGVLMPNVKCALSHIPKPLEGSGVNRVANEVKLHFNPTNPIVTLCENCRPMRRCPECPTEYLIQVTMMEDKTDPDPRKLFKQALIMTRWSDLGDGTSPLSSEWAACTGMPGFEFDSFKALGKRAVSGQFESEVYGDVIPGQKMLSMNPEKTKLGEQGHEWY